MGTGFFGVAVFAGLAVLPAAPAFATLAVSAGATSNVSCISGTCTATAANAVLNEKDFRHLIGAGDLTLVSGAEAQDIVIDAKVQWTKAHHLTLDSFRGIAFALELASEGGGGATLTINDGGSGGALTFANGKGKMTFWDTSSSLTINGTSYKLANDIATLAADIAANPSGAFALGRGYDASADGTYAATPISKPFGGIFNGLGHAIDNLTIDRVKPKRVPTALFDSILPGGAASDVSLDAASVTSSSGDTYIAIFAGANAGTIRNVSVSGNVRASARTGYVAGLVGLNSGLVDLSRSAGAVYGGPRYIVAAGLVANNKGTVSRSTSSMGVAASTAACGLVGDNFGTVTLSSATGGAATPTPHNSSTRAAGLVCTSTGTVSQSFASGDVDAGFGKEGESHDWIAYGGGLVAENIGTIQDCYAMSAVTAQPDLTLGGLVSTANGIIETSYAAGAVTVTAGQISGGLVGNQTPESSEASTYWDLDTSGISDPSKGVGNLANAPGVTGLTTAQLQSGLPSGFDPSVWGQSPGINNGYPYLIANPPQ